jgi:transketolase
MTVSTHQLQTHANKARAHVLKTVHHANAGHVGGPMSAIDIITYLYFKELQEGPGLHARTLRNRFVLSKGHSAIGLYAVLAEIGLLPEEELKTFDSLNSRLQGHPDMKALPLVDMSTGSLGQGISAAVGMALGAKLTKSDFRTYCMLGDGESQEGQVWEAAFVAAKYKLDNFVVILDRNRLQQFGWQGVDDSMDAPSDNDVAKWQAFGWHTMVINGHSFEEIEDAFQSAKQIKDKPTIIIANTVKGKGVSFMENQYLWHSKVPTEHELILALEELAVKS